MAAQPKSPEAVLLTNLDNNIESDSSSIFQLLTHFKINMISLDWVRGFSLRKMVYSLSVLYIFWMFAKHGVKALMVTEKYLPVVSVIFPADVAPAVLIVVGLIDISIACMLLVRNQPWVLIYAGIYPFIPLSLTFIATGELELFGKFLIFSLSVFALFAAPVETNIIESFFSSREYTPKRLLASLSVAILLILTSTLSVYFVANSSDGVVEEILVEEDDWRTYSVVAPIDTGINVYHEHFILNETLPDWLLEGLGVTMWCNLTLEGTWQERYEADQESCWDIITSTDIVYFLGTRIIGTTPDDGTDIPILDDPSDGHGTAVTGAVLDANPDAIIFFVEGFSDAAVLAAANQPLVDIISTSFGPIGSVPVSGIEDATRVAVVENHKVHTGAADNSPSPAVQDSTAGPPWSIGISGYAEEGDDQKEIMSGSYPDIAADWTQMLPNHDDIDGYHETSGTSFATPRTAGILSLVLTQLRDLGEDMGSGASSERDGLLVNGTNLSVSNQNLREALNLSAWYPGFSTWDPTSGTAPISPIAPCTQVGWGVVNMSNVEPMYSHLAGIELMPNRPSDVVACMEANQAIREAYWGD